MPPGDLDPNEIPHFNLQEQVPIQVPGLSLFQPHCHFILRLLRCGPAMVTLDSALQFNKKGAQCKEQARKGEGRGREGKGRERRRQGRREARSLVILLLSTSTTALDLTHAFLRC